MRSIAKSASPDLIHCLSEVCYNLLRGAVEISARDKKKLSKYKTHIRKVASKGTSVKSKRTLIQKGGFLPSLLAPLAPVIGSILSPLVKSMVRI